MIEKSKVDTNPTLYEVELTRCQNGRYRWNIKVSGSQLQKVIDEIDLVEQGLRTKYLKP